ncbi:MAG TPA: hypothetical protein VLH09_10410, partial [Bryobacteraceae bacterium]|nr:hypothetical protein [Bryobacteraceae bacterium]
MIREARYHGRMARGFRDFLRTPPVRDPHGLVRSNLENREKHFLDMARRLTCAGGENPYRKLFAWAGCTFGDIETSVRESGLEATLEALRKSGVYLSHDEFKGRRPIERAGLRLEAVPGDFINPAGRGTLEVTSSGSRSQG